MKSSSKPHEVCRYRCSRPTLADSSRYKLVETEENVDLSPPAASCPPTVCVPVLLPLLTLMERSSVMSEGAELWETNDQGCDIMLRHLEAARGVAHNTRSYTQNAERMLQGESGAWTVSVSRRLALS